MMLVKVITAIGLLGLLSVMIGATLDLLFKVSWAVMVFAPIAALCVLLVVLVMLLVVWKEDL